MNVLDIVLAINSIGIVISAMYILHYFYQLTGNNLFHVPGVTNIKSFYDIP